jgi:hypothetical protein
MKRHRIPISFATWVVLFPAIGAAHHSYAEYNQQETVEIEGTLQKVSWQNPHVRFTVLVPSKNGQAATWDIESSGINNLMRMGAKVEHFKTGENVKVAGWPSRRGTGRMYVTNLLSQNGHELVLWRFSKLRWAKNGAGYSTGADARLFTSGTPSTSRSLFRVWSTDLDDPDANTGALRRSLNEKTPFTPAAAKARATWDPSKDTGFVGCEPKGMPNIMGQPFPIQFVDKGGTLELHIEEYDVVRVIHLKPPADLSSRPPTPEGHSTGRWDGNSLVVTTSRLTARPFDDTGFQRSTSASLVERFTPSDDGSRLHYSVVITDPEVFTQPVEMKRSWVWRPGEKVMPFNCKP